MLKELHANWNWESREKSEHRVIERYMGRNGEEKKRKEGIREGRKRQGLLCYHTS